jgi:uncharacterized iron-regulated membrane protein
MFRRQATGRARDFNWHNVIGFWCAPVLIVLTASGVVMSYPWANSLVYRLTGSPLPSTGERNAGPAQARGQGRGGGPGAAGQPGGRGGRAGGDEVVRPVRLADNLDQLWARAEQQVPQWRTMSLRLPNRAGAPAAFTISDATYWNPFARSQLTLDSASAAVVRWDPYSNNSLGQKVRGWLRFAHTGELGGVPGQTVAAIASLGGAVLVWTGFALAWRRLLRWKPVQRRVSRGRLAQDLVIVAPPPTEDVAWEDQRQPSLTRQ